MSEDYIIVHKPKSLLNVTNAVNTPKSSKRKSTNKRTPARKQHEVCVTETTDILQLVFKQFVQKLEDTKRTIHEDLFESVYKNIVEYYNYYSNKRSASKEASLKLINDNNELLFNPICHVIPTIALFTGINFQDYSSLCDRLGDRLKDQFTPNIFWISEQNSQNIKTLSNSLFSQWSSISENESSSNKIVSFRQFFNIINTQSKANQNSILFVFKQFELIPRDTIENFVSLISCYIENIPIYFMIQLASQTNIIYEQLSSSSISKLCIKRLFFMSPEQYLEKFLTKLFIEQSTIFKLSGDILKYLVEIYYEYNFSISNFIHAIKYCFFDHLQTDNVNMLFVCSQLEDANLYESILNQLTSQNKLKDILSNNKQQTSSLELNTYQNDWIKYNNQFVLICRFLYEIIKNFPSEKDEDSLFSSQIKSFADFYVKISYLCNTNKSSNFTELSQYLKLKNIIQISSNNTINEIVCSLLNIINKCPMENQANYTDDFLDEIVDFSDILEKLKQNFNEMETNEICNEEQDENISESVELQKTVKNNKIDVIRRGSLKPTNKKILGELNSDLARTNSLFLAPKPVLKKTVGDVVQKKKLNNNASINYRYNMLDWLENQFSIYFNKDYAIRDAYSSHFCYSNLVKVKKRLFDVSRINIHNCLFNADEILKKTNNSQVSTTESPKKRTRNSLIIQEPIEIKNDIMYPLGVVYRIYLECGHMINLFDWLQAFVERMENVDLKELSQPKRKLMQALFFRSITELQFMGFIKPTSRKVDHVVKLTNGSFLLSLDNEN